MANGTIAASQLEMLSLSGTGIITITPPATNTNRAITLPDAAGALVVSGTTPSLNGITFPATQVPSADANTLDDYEEGTWTPNQGAGLTVVGAFSSSGFYTKTGRSVTVIGVVTGATSITTSGSGIVCTSLPFTVLSGASATGVITNTATNNSNLYLNPGTTHMYSSTATGASGSLYFSVTYFTS
jgi:hypothetical protein